MKYLLIKIKKLQLLVSRKTRRFIFFINVFPLKLYNKTLFLHLLTGVAIPTIPKRLSWRDIDARSTKDYYEVFIDKEIYFLPKEYGSIKSVKQVFQRVLNEQLLGSPHRYLQGIEIQKNWVIYDLGACEGYQAKQWLKSCSKVVMFEPIKSFANSIRKTYSKELANGKAILIEKGVSDKHNEIKYNDSNIVVDSLDNIVQKENIPMPDYIKVDIEGEELRFLKGANKVLQRCKILEIATYHRPNDYINIPQYLSRFNGKGSFVEGRPMIWNGNGKLEKNPFKIHKPIIRKCLYRFVFDNYKK